MQNEFAGICIGKIDFQIDVGILIRSMILQTSIQMTARNAWKLLQYFDQFFSLLHSLGFSFRALFVLADVLSLQKTP